MMMMIATLSSHLGVPVVLYSEEKWCVGSRDEEDSYDGRASFDTRSGDPTRRARARDNTMRLTMLDLMPIEGKN